MRNCVNFLSGYINDVKFPSSLYGINFKILFQTLQTCSIFTPYLDTASKLFDNCCQYSASYLNATGEMTTTTLIHLEKEPESSGYHPRTTY